MEENNKRKFDSGNERPNGPKKTMKRKHKDEKYGFGGKKKRMKSNTGESAADFSDYSKFKNQSVDKDLQPRVCYFLIFFFDYSILYCSHFIMF